MKKSLKLLALVLAFVCIAVFFCACGEGEPEQVTLVGQWNAEGIDDCYYLFEADGTGVYKYGTYEGKFTYEDDGAKVTLTYENATEPNVFAYTIEGKKLKIEDSFGSIVVYVRK